MKLTGVNFWSNGRQAVFIDANDNIISEFKQAFVKTQWHPDIVSAMKEYNFDLHKDHIICNDSLEDAIMRLNMNRKQAELPIKCDPDKLEIWISNKLKSLLSEEDQKNIDSWK